MILTAFFLPGRLLGLIQLGKTFARCPYQTPCQGDVVMLFVPHVPSVYAKLSSEMKSDRGPGASSVVLCKVLWWFFKGDTNMEINT